jgi:hypothetical protein
MLNELITYSEENKRKFDIVAAMGGLIHAHVKFRKIGED